MCADDGSTDSTCLTGRDGVCEPTLEITRKAIFLGGTTAATDFYLELAFQTQGSLCHYSVSWASSRPVRQVRLFALEHQFGTMRGADDPGASCFEGTRFKVVNGVNENYNIVSNSLEYDPRFSTNGVSGLLYGAGDRTSDIFFGTSSTSANFRSASRVCPTGLNGTNLPASFKVVIEGGGIPSAGLNNFLDDSTAPNSDNVGKKKNSFFFSFFSFLVLLIPALLFSKVLIGFCCRIAEYVWAMKILRRRMTEATSGTLNRDPTLQMLELPCLLILRPSLRGILM
jgi:hypothetical protein